MRYIWLLFLFTGLIIRSMAQQPAVAADPVCISEEDFHLFRMVNDLRTAAKLQPLPLSGSLCRVAQLHVADLLTWSPVKEGCNLQSWSSNGKWTPCCYGKDPSGNRCMNEKPNELTGYQGLGSEIVYWEESGVNPEGVMNVWKDITAAREMILNGGQWKNKAWKAIGISMNQGYASLWFGDTPDKLADIRLCGTDSLLTRTTAKPDAGGKPVKANEPVHAAVKETISTPGSAYYYVITASVKTQQEADQKLQALLDEGYSQAGQLSFKSGIRVFINKYTTEAEARKTLNQLKNKFDGIWMLKN